MKNRLKQRLFVLSLAISVIGASLLGFGPVAASRSLGQEQSASSAIKSAPAQLRFAIIGDAGTADEHQLAVAREMLAEFERKPFPFVLTVGDNTYLGCRNRLEDVFEIPYSALLSRGVKFYATLGNHDEDCADEQIAYPMFNMNGKRYYTFKPAGDLVEFFAIDTTLVVNGKAPEQFQWLEQALKASKATWKIAFFHHPAFSPARKHGDEKDVVARIVPLLERYGVRVVLTGHDHILAKLVTRNGVDYFVCGASAKMRSNGIRDDYAGLEYAEDEFRGFFIVELNADSFDYAIMSADGQVRYRGSLPVTPVRQNAR
ncbi:MAG: metallophosphoesterase [Blastocatellia bacterium]